MRRKSEAKSETTVTPGTEAVELIELEKLVASPYQPRLSPLKKPDVEEPMEAIEAAGQLSPIIVQPIPDDPERYWVHSGHRRWAALRFLNLLNRTNARAVGRRDLQESDARKVALSDNLGRADLSAYEQANALRGYCDATGLSVEQAAAELGLNAAARRIGEGVGYREGWNGGADGTFTGGRAR